MAFKGWPVEAIEFYEGLQADNTKTYWVAHKATYDECVLRPMQELIAELEPEFGEGKIFRPYRDVRFSADKTPYKTAIGAVLAGGGYVQLSAEGLGSGCGRWHLEPEELARYRDAVADDASGAPLQAIVDQLRAAKIDVSSHGELKTVPRGYPKDHPRAELLRAKGLVSWQSWPAAAWLGTAKAKDRVVGFLRASVPLNDWLAKNLT
ncbi:MAG TPA: DUF2461 domain-containing protein [Mycobacteriales bacterium]|nr:DUF2461 domain-containing protein [Mycobacteriales bacterium]